MTKVEVNIKAMDWITENIAIGNYLDAEQPDDKVDAILCLKENCCNEDNSDYDIVAIPLIDGSGNDPRAFNDAVDFIDDVVSSGKKILVHCHAGRSRSVCIVARYFMVKHNLTVHQALQKIQAKREIYLSTGIEEILKIN
jgi:protein-tyrosine phosphatase